MCCSIDERFFHEKIQKKSTLSHLDDKKKRLVFSPQYYEYQQRRRRFDVITFAQRRRRRRRRRRRPRCFLETKPPKSLLLSILKIEIKRQHVWVSKSNTSSSSSSSSSSSRSLEVQKSPERRVQQQKKVSKSSLSSCLGVRVKTPRKTEVAGEEESRRRCGSIRTRTTYSRGWTRSSPGHKRMGFVFWKTFPPIIIIIIIVER